MLEQKMLTFWGNKIPKNVLFILSNFKKKKRKKNKNQNLELKKRPFSEGGGLKKR